MKAFRAVIYSILSLALSAFCIFKIIESKDFEPSIKIRITDNTVINSVIDTAMKFTNNLQAPFVVILGIVALLFNVLFSFRLHEFFSEVPLGSVKKVDYFKKRKPVATILSSLSPALVIGLYTAVHLLLQRYMPEKITFYIKWFLPSAVLLALIAFFVLIINAFISGGVWGLIIRVPVLFTENFCLDII